VLFLQGEREREREERAEERERERDRKGLDWDRQTDKQNLSATDSEKEPNIKSSLLSLSCIVVASVFFAVLFVFFIIRG
jgi:hypothetical protein